MDVIDLWNQNYPRIAPERELRPARTGLLNVGIGAMAVVSLLGGIIFSGNIFALADPWYRALTVMLAYSGMGG